MSELDDLARRAEELEIEGGRGLKRVLSSLGVGDYVVMLALILIIFFGMILSRSDDVPNGFSSVTSGVK